MWLLITVLMTCSLHEVAESYKQMHWSHMKNVIEPVKEVQPRDVQCLAKGSNGNEYRGTISVTSQGQRCLYWDQIQHIGEKAVSQGLGSHNYCRNPDNSSGPWCWVRGRARKVRRFCDIPQCEAKTELPSQDTEMTCGERSPKKIFKIIGGLRASIESQPWLASIFKKDLFICGGTLIAPCWVLSAAHCFPRGKRTRKEQYSVYLGKDATNATYMGKEQKFEVAKLVLHQDFDYAAEDFNNDIALLQIVDNNGQCAQKTPSARTACLPPAQHMPPYGSFCHIAGYGHERNDEIPGTFRYSRYMKETQVQILSPIVCKRKDYYGNKVTENQFCAASQKWTEDACHGDSGGPLLCEVKGRMFLFGVISWGDGCATKFKPGVYTKITNYNNWIAKETGLLTFTKGIMYPRKD
ncbi:plasminogen activator, urokinase a isoform X1 [Ictalurus punctatus]|uniref:trypsin n=1 Tax=Ictalurus punctatus TaxID=7998 RepID=A0A2D0QJP6_ICTPU|nr:plasminogen activator, urokinase a isoform X1 [Ictalurus punctatus]